jgi:hypothetical protein
MADIASQSFANHARFVRTFHLLVGPIFLLNLIWALYRLLTEPGLDRAVAALVAVALLFLGFHARNFALTVQNRVIRLEERLRLARLLPPALRPRIDELTHRQLVALRFASDEELPALAEAVLKEGLTDGKEIKRRVRQWRADHLRV